MPDKHKIVVMAAYNAAQTLHMTYAKPPDTDAPVPTSCFPRASSVQRSTYGLRFELHRLSGVQQRQFQSPYRRYSGAPRREDEPARS